jgi:signal transduction histidine kinase/HAMP domain-containing protein/CheY-like chemotaxis protein
MPTTEQTRTPPTPPGGPQTGCEALLAQLAAALHRARAGDLKVRVPRGVGVAGEVADAFNDVVALQQRQQLDLKRISRLVGREGRLTERLDDEGYEGAWADGVRSINSLIDDLGRPATEIARVIEAVADGDLTQHMPPEIDGRPLRGEFLRIGRTVNTMVDQLSSFADEVTRMSRDVGTEGKLGGQANVRGVSGTWRDLTDSVNTMASNLTDQVRSISQVTTAIAHGDLSQKITVSARGEVADLAQTINSLTDTLRVFAEQVTRVAREVGTEGKLGGQAQVPGVAGTWKDLTDNVNSMASNLTSQVRNISQVATAVAKGDLSQKITVAAQGEILEVKDTVNTMVDQLSSFADEVTRVAREVGTEGKLGGQAQVFGVSGTWRDLTENVNQLAGNLTNQVRNIASVATAVAKGDLSQKITVDARGEILALKTTVNTMVDQLSSFADEVTRVAREVGTEGKLGGQAQVKGVSGTWQDLTENVNQLASTLTTQLRAISQVSTAVTRGDLTQAITVQAQGEVASLKDNINQMIVTLRETTSKNAHQAWLDSNLARIGGLLQGERDLGEVTRMIIDDVTPLVHAQLGAFFLADDENASPRLRLAASYGYVAHDRGITFGPGEGLVGQAAVTRNLVRIARSGQRRAVNGGDGRPAPGLTIRSGLSETPPVDLVVLPVLFEGELLGVIEFASVVPFSDLNITFLQRLVATIGVALNTIQANKRTEELLAQSQRLAHELQEQSAELQRTNAELEEKAALLQEQKGNIETKNREIELARIGLEEKAQQLARASAYKSEFLANMSHELRTPLNSLLLLARLLADNSEQNLTAKQIEFANTIHSAGSDLLSLIDDILDLSKIEAGRAEVQPTEVDYQEIRGYVEQGFAPQAAEKGLEFRVEVDPELAGEVLVTDAQRLQQILRNLISNAVKFTDHGSVRLRIAPAPPELVFDVATLATARQVIGFTVADTGIGISDDQLNLVFEAFQQADGTNSRRFGGTGLGLSISRDLSGLIGGTITAKSEPGHGSAFTLYLPDVLVPEAVSPPDPSVPVGRAGSQPPMVRTPESTHRRNTPAADQLEGTSVLIVDDDVRNVFALTSALELHGMTVLYADNGADGNRLLTEHPEVDIVLMDAMMPEQDGYETTRAIRRHHQFAELPIVFLTAKAMPGDRESALAAGGTEYITKPVDLDELLELMASCVKPERSRPGGGS